MTSLAKYCRYCGNRKSDHKEWSRCAQFVPQGNPKCRVCGSGFDPAKSGRSDCCYRHRLDS